MSTATLCKADECCVVLIDAQQKLLAAMPRESLDPTLRACTLLLDAAVVMDLPVLCTEQYPRGLGATVSSLASRLPSGTTAIAKTSFACSGEPAFVDALAALDRRQVVLIGMETHVCVLQTALELQAQSREVFVVEDAVCARHHPHHRNGLTRLGQAGVAVSNSESVMFEWVRDARHEQFRAVSDLVKQGGVSASQDNDWRIG